MKIYISLDMEGIAGTHSWTQEENNRDVVRRCMTQQIEWVIEGISQSTANNKITEIAVADSHSAGDNLIYDITKTDERVYLISGFPRPHYMMPAFNDSYDVVFFVGYHGGIGTVYSNMDHSYTPRFHRIWMNDLQVNESLINAAYAGYYNVPVGLIIGDDSLEKQIKQDDCLPWVDYVLTKYSLSRFSVKNRPFDIVMQETINTVRNFFSRDIKDIPVFKFSSPVTLRIELQTTSQADIIEMMPDVRRLDGFTVEFRHNDYKELFDSIDAFAALARSAKW